MEIVTGDRAATVAPADAVRLLHEMAAVVRTVFAVAATPTPAAPSSGGAAPDPIVPTPTSVPSVAPIVAAEPPASIPVPGVAILEEIAFLDDRP